LLFDGAKKLPSEMCQSLSARRSHCRVMAFSELEM
jgi:hypothetical protein